MQGDSVAKARALSLLGARFGAMKSRAGRHGRRSLSTADGLATRATERILELDSGSRDPRPRNEEFSLLTLTRLTLMFPFCSIPNEGRIAIVTNVGWNAVDASVSSDVRHGCGRRRRVVLAPLGWC